MTGYIFAMLAKRIQIDQCCQQGFDKQEEKKQNNGK